MFYIRILLLITSWHFIACEVKAQGHYHAWFRATLSTNGQSKISWDAELQYRLQNDFKNHSVPDKNLLLSARSWLHYQQSKTVKFSLSPFAYFSQYKVIQQQSDENAQPINEIRLSAAVQKLIVVLPKLQFVTRTAFEYRIFKTNPDVIRFREKLKFEYSINAKATLSIYDELFVNTRGNSFRQLLDQNRAGVDLQYTISKSLKFNLGYLYAARLNNTGITPNEDHNILFAVGIQL